MSKIGRMPISVSDSVTVLVTNGIVKVSGSKGEYTYAVPDALRVTFDQGILTVSQKIKNDTSTYPIYGLARATLANMVKGVEKGFEKRLVLTGVGYRAQVQGKDLVLSLGFSHPVKVTPPDSITFTVAENIITVSGSDKTLVGDLAAKIRAFRKPEPYKGKGIKYEKERIRRKAGKAAKAVGATK